MLTLALTVIIIFGIVVLGFIVIRKFPQVGNLDLTNLSEEKLNIKKREILNKRIEQSGHILKQKIMARMSFFPGLWGVIQLKFRIYVGKIERLLHHEQALKKKEKSGGMDSEEKEQKIAQFMNDGETQLKLGNLEQAENSFIAAIAIDPKSAAAYRGLADTYYAKNSWEEARQTYRFLLRLEPDDDSVLVKLAELAESQGDAEEAIGYYQQAILINDSFSPRFYHLAELLLKVGQPKVAMEAVLQAIELEPQNPRYLDLLIETAIICGNKDIAIKAYNDLRMVNPDNQKLESFKERIAKLDASFGLKS